MKGRVIHIEEFMDSEKFVTYWQVSIRAEAPPKDIRVGACELKNIKDDEVETYDKAYYG